MPSHGPPPFPALYNALVENPPRSAGPRSGTGGIPTPAEVMMADREALGVGEPAPDFALPSATGETVRLSDFRGKAEVVLFFYPKDNSPACTLEACSFRDSHEAFREAGAEVIGISADPADSHRRFSERFRLPFVLLTDVDGAVRHGTASPAPSACSRAGSPT